MSSNFCVCCGAEIPEGTQVCLRCQKNGGPLPHETADEMFRELGYEKVNNNRYIKIEDMNPNSLWTYTQIVVGEEETIKQTVCESERSLYDKYLSAKEILACAQLIKEMEGQK